MQIAIKYEGTTLANDPDYDEWGNDGVRLILRCQHDNLVIEPPCCNGTDCDCRGQYTLYCPDCENTLTEKEIEDRLESSLDEGDYR
jgi:hypothetical protein